MGYWIPFGLKVYEFEKKYLSQKILTSNDNNNSKGNNKLCPADNKENADGNNKMQNANIGKRR